MISEELLHYVWQHQFFNREDLKTEEGEQVQIVRPGNLNTHSGPDFFNGQIYIGDLLWVGNVEIHIRSSDWFKHHHQEDPAYSKLILHVVWEHDQEVVKTNGTFLPVLVLKGRVKRKLIEQYTQLKASKSWIACEHHLRAVEPIYVQQMFNRMAIERLQNKSKRIEQLLQLHKNDWEAVFYQLLARSFGFKVNALPFELLAVNIPFTILRKYQNDEMKFNALFFGQAGFLNTTPLDEFQAKLHKEYQHLKRLHQLTSLEVSIWKFLRMRPSNFPTLRIAQFVQFFLVHKRPFENIRLASSIEELHQLLAVGVHPYWRNHYHFGKKFQQGKNRPVGKASREVIIINSVVPILFTWLKTQGKGDPAEVLDILQRLKSEDNSISRGWKEKGIQVESAFDSQACLQLKQTFCTLKKCLNCTIGNAILKA